MTKYASKEKIYDWIRALDEDQANDVIYFMLNELLGQEHVRFWQDEDNTAPYFEMTGEPLVDHQSTWSEEEML
jgi:hypothetical protein